MLFSHIFLTSKSLLKSGGKFTFFHLSHFVNTLSAAFDIIPTSNSHDYHVVSFGGKISIDRHACLSYCVKMRENVYFYIIL